MLETQGQGKVLATQVPLKELEQELQALTDSGFTFPQDSQFALRISLQ